MGKILRCREVGMDCDFEARGESVEKLIQNEAKHAKEAHGMEEIPSRGIRRDRNMQSVILLLGFALLVFPQSLLARELNDKEKKMISDAVRENLIDPESARFKWV